jgi:hypothetical protein
MPDLLGDLYEGLLAHSFERRGWNIELQPSRPSATCRQSCPFRIECQKTIDPTIDVDPDIRVTLADGTSLTAFVTHWRTTGFEKKFWRTAEEIFEYILHRPTDFGLNYVAEPISQSDNLRQGLGRLCGNSIDMQSNWTTQLQASIEHLEVNIVPRFRPSSPEGIKEYCDGNRESDGEIEEYLGSLEASLTSILPLKQGEIDNNRLFDLCITSRRRFKGWNARDISTDIRTPAQLLALILHAAMLDNVSFYQEDFTFGSSSRKLKGKKLIHLRNLAKVPYRIRRGEGLPFISVQSSLVGDKLLLDQLAFPVTSRTAGVYQAAAAYLGYLSSDVVWSNYLTRLCEVNLLAGRLGALIGPEDLPALVERAIIDRRESWVIDMLLSAADESQVSFAARLEQKFQLAYGHSFRRLAPYGDEGKKVVAACARGASDSLKPITGLSRERTLSILSGLFVDEFLEILEFPVSEEKSMVSARIKYLKTFLSGAPHPIIGGIQGILRELNIAFTVNKQERTIVNEWYGGNTGRTVYQFRLEHAEKIAWIKVSTGQDGHESDKWKELASRMRAHGLVADQVPEVWLVLDGNWTAAMVQKLYESGYSNVFSADGLGELKSTVMAWATRDGNSP